MIKHDNVFEAWLTDLMTLCSPLSLSNPREHRGHFRLECTFSSDRLKNACDPLTVAKSLEEDKKYMTKGMEIE